jgi:hypothetical protein
MIIGKLLKDLYGLHPLGKSMRLSLTDNHERVLEEWRQEVANTFGFDFPYRSLSSTANPLVCKETLALTLTYYHVIILLYRPFLLDTFSEDPVERDRMKEHVQACIESCMNIVESISHLYDKDRSFHALWVSLVYLKAIGTGLMTVF